MFPRLITAAVVSLSLLLTGTHDPAVAISSLPDTTASLGYWNPFNSNETVNWATSPPTRTQEEGMDGVWGASSSNCPPQTKPQNYPESPTANWHEFYDAWGGMQNICESGYGSALAYFQAVDPSWIEYKADKTTPASIDGTDILDMSNPAVQSWVLNNEWLPAMAGGYQGISIDWGVLDNSGAAVGCFCGPSGAWRQQYSGASDDSAWKSAQEAALASMVASFHASYPAASVTMNESFDCGHTLADYQAAIASVSVVNDEDGFTNYGASGNNYVTTAPNGNCSNYWLDKVQQDVAMGKAGQGLYFDNQEPYTASNDMTGTNTTAKNDLQWALANYLLVKYSHTYFWWGGVQQYGYPFFWQQEETAAQGLGAATGDYYAWSGVYRRDFTGGAALVNPDPSQTFTVTLPAGIYQDLYGNAITQLSMPPHSGDVLLSTGQPVPTGTATALPPTPTATTTPPSAGQSFGVASHFTWHGTAQSEISWVQQAGLTSARFDVDWLNYETARGVYDQTNMANLSSIMSQLASDHIRPIVTVFGTPGWANGNAGEYVPPTNSQDFADFMGTLAADYCADNAVWEIWNEPNDSHFWQPAPNASQYVALLQPTYTEIKAKCPSATVLAGSILYNDQAYLSGMYAAGAAGYFDGLAVHPYTSGALAPNDPDTQDGGYYSFYLTVEDTEQTAANNGQPNEPLWLTEMGWSTQNVADSLRATYYQEAVADVQGWPYVAAMEPYTLDSADDASYGMVTNGVGDQSWTAYLAAVQSTNPAASPTTTPSATPTTTPPNSPSPTPTIPATSTATPTAAPNPTANPTSTATALPTPTSTPVPTATSTPKPTPSPTPVPCRRHRKCRVPTKPPRTCVLSTAVPPTWPSRVSSCYPIDPHR